MDHREGEKQVVGKIFVKRKCEKTLRSSVILNLKKKKKKNEQVFR